MRLRSAISVSVVLGGSLLLASCSLVLGIGDPTLDPAGGTAGAGGVDKTTSQTSGTGGGPGSGGSGGGVAPCAPTKAECIAVKSDCLALVDHSAESKAGLRIGQIDFYKPDAFSGTIEKGALSSSITMNYPQCNLKGSGTFSWLVELDLNSLQFRTGVSKPPMDPLMGYSFVNETINTGGMPLDVKPITGNFTFDAKTGAVNSDALDFVVLPVYLDFQATTLLVIPVHHVRIFDTTLSADHNCVGSYNSYGLKPSNGCLPDVSKNIFAFIDGGSVDGYVLLEEADDVIITSFGLNRSLCVLLSNNASVFGDGGSPAKCKRDGNNKIKYPGDWCAASNMGADGVCYDAVQFSGGFAASAVKLNN